MSIETWNEEHRAVLCSICGKRGPNVYGTDSGPVTEARAVGWWARETMTRLRTPVLEGSCMNLMQGLGAYSSHRIEIKVEEKMDWRSVCPECLANIRRDREHPEEAS